VDRLVRVDPDLELDEGIAAAFAGGRLDLVDAVDRTDGRFHLLGYLCFDPGRRGAGLADRHVDRREIDVRAVVDVHPVERDQPAQRQPDEQDYRDDRVTDRPRGNIPEIHWLAACALSETTTGLIRSPSLTKPPARRITRSSPVRPATTAMPSSVTI